MLAHPLVSRQHCELYEADGQLMVRDLGSLNGTFVNNQKVSEAPLPPGELLTIGTVTFRAVYESQGEVSPPKGPAPQLKAGKASASADTLKAGPKAAKAAAKPPVADDVEFDFEKPLMPLDDVETPSGPLHSTKRLEASPANAPAAKAVEKKPEAKSPPAKQSKPASPAAKASPAKPTGPAAGKPPAGKPPAGRGDAATIDFKKQMDDDEDDEKVASSSDDDLDDFLKSLEK
jgi:predicted component of type VI protein secretion system